jgi:hypothetical protein
MSVVSHLVTRTGRVSFSVLCLLCAAMPVCAASIRVPAGGDLQAALNGAQSGDDVLLAAGAVYTGNFRLPATSALAYITIRTESTLLPPPGVRVTPADAPQLAKIKSPNGSPALATADGAHHWRIENVEFPATAAGAGDIVALGSGSQATPTAIPHDLVLDRVYVHGDPVAGQKRGVALNSGYTEIINSYIADIKASGVDSQAICGWNGPGPYLIANNYLEAAGENVMFGGADPAVWNQVPSDITLRRNVLSKPTAWMGANWSVKNLLEFKNARRVLVEGNVLENVWKGGQAGFAVQITPRNQGGKAPWSTVEDVTFRYNVVRHAGSAINISGWDDLQASGQAQRIQIANNLFFDIDGPRWGGASGIFVQVGNSPRSLTVERNTVVHSGTVLSVYGTRNGAPWVVDGLVFRDNLMEHNLYGVKGDALAVGQQTLSAYFSNLIFERNVLAGGPASAYPGGNYFPSEAEFMAAFVNVAGEDYSLVAGTQFRTGASDGGALGADVSTVRAAFAGVAPGVTPGSGVSPTGMIPGVTGVAVCRNPPGCPAVNPYSHPR